VPRSFETEAGNVKPNSEEEILTRNPLQGSQADGSVQSTTSTRQAADDGETIQERVRRRVYELFEERGGTDGHEVDDWMQAEAEVLGRARRAA